MMQRRTRVIEKFHDAEKAWSNRKISLSDSKKQNLGVVNPAKFRYNVC